MSHLIHVNLTHSCYWPAEKGILNSCVHSSKSGFLKKQIAARGGFLALIPGSAMLSAADTVTGIGAGIAAVLTGGKHERTRTVAMNCLNSSRYVAALPYRNLLRVLNPQAQFEFASGLRRRQDPRDKTDGVITHYVSTAFKNAINSYRDSKYFLTRHVATRLIVALLAVSLVISRVVDACIGIIAGTLSLLTFGKVFSINHLAYRALQSPGIIQDFFYCAIKLVNPWAMDRGRLSSQEESGFETFF